MRKTMLIILGVIFLISCRKDEDTEAPLIEITAPAENSQHDVFSEILVTGTVYDNKHLEYIKIQLTDKDLNPVLPAVRLSPDNNTYTLNTSYKIDDRLLETNDYYLQVQASDGIHATNEFISVRINEAPRKLKFLVAVTRNGSHLNVVKIDSALQASTLFTLTTDYLASGISSDLEQFYICGKAYSDLHVYNVNTWQPNWDIQVITNPPAEWFTGLMIYNGYSYVGYREGRFEKYNGNGAKQYSANTATGYSPLHFCRVGDKLITEEKSISGPQRMIEIYYEPSGAPLGEYLNAEPTIALLPLSADEVCHLTNDPSGQGHLYLLNLTVPAEWEPPSTFATGRVRCAMLVNNEVMIGHESGVYRYVESNANLVQVINNINASAFCYDDNQKIIYVAEYKALKLYYDPWPGMPYCQYLNSVSLNDTILAVHAVYNKD